MRNVELKARINERTKFLETARAICGGQEPQVLDQTDTFFYSQKGRLKLREQSSAGSTTAQLILYDRPDVEGPKLSDFTIAGVNDPDGMKNILAKSNGIAGIVEKRRYLLIHEGRTRIHVDSVRGLGDFMEIEVCLKDDESHEDGEKVASLLAKQLGVEDTDLVKGAYVDAISSD